VSQESIQGSESGDVQPWEGDRSVRRMSEMEALLSRGFLRCRPDRWFPGFSAQWLPVSHAFGCEVTLSDVRTVLEPPPKNGTSFTTRVANEPLVISLDEDSASALAGEVVPGADGFASEVVVEYLMRRLFFSLAASWTGSESASASFLGASSSEGGRIVGSIRLALTVNTSPVVVWFGLGERMVSTLDGLWRRQVQSTTKAPVAGAAQVRLEVAQLGVPPQMLADYLKAGTVIDLEVRASDLITVRVGAKAWMPGRMVNVNGMFGCEVLPGAVSAPAVPDGTTRLAVELGSVALEGPQVAELGQVGAIIVTDSPFSRTVNLVINQEVVGRAQLCTYEGRFAIEVLG
jgi:flagellar motor switch/type III secretory pathway protein FliN